MLKYLKILESSLATNLRMVPIDHDSRISPKSTTGSYDSLFIAIAVGVTNQSDWFNLKLPSPGSMFTSVPPVYLHTAKLPSTPDDPEDPDVPPVPLVPDVPARPLVPDVPARPLVPDVPSTPLVPDVPARPLVPDVPDIPLVPDDPLVPSAPGIPVVMRRNSSPELGDPELFAITEIPYFT